MSFSTPKVLWQPSEATKQQSNLTHYIAWLKTNRQLEFTDYQSLWEWSVARTEAFWESLIAYFHVQLGGSYARVLSLEPMPYSRWFEGTTVNYAAHIFRQQTNAPAIIFCSENEARREISWAQLSASTAAVAQWLRQVGVQPGDRVAAFMPNIPEATVAFLASCSVGAVWTACSPDFGVGSVVDRFAQVTPKILFAVDGYRYGGKQFDRSEVVQEIVQQLPSLEYVVQIPHLDSSKLKGTIAWGEVEKTPANALTFEVVPFGHPIWILYSSGTTGQPKAITHSHGGVLLEHLKYITFHNDVKHGEKYFWFTTTGWMMWNFVQATLLAGATIVLYDGSPGFPDLEVLWRMAAAEQIQHFGTSAPFIIACMKAGLNPASKYDLSALRSISSTGSPLPPEGFAWVYEQVKPDVWLCSMSGGTDVCSAFVGGCPLLPVYEGEIQCRALGCSMESVDDQGQSLRDEVGEMVITQPMPSMPIYFWNDPEMKRYRESYFEEYAGWWRHGDWLMITSRNTLVIKGRSDATLNRHGVRIGTAEIYQAVNKVDAVLESLVVNLELENGQHFMPLFVQMKPENTLTEQVQQQIARQLKTDFSPRHVPDQFVEVTDIPHTISGKKMEAPVKKILMGYPVEKAANTGAMRNPDSLQFFVNFAKNGLIKKD